MSFFSASSGCHRLVVKATCCHRQPSSDNQPPSSSSTIKILADTCTTYSASGLRPLNPSGRVSYNSFLRRAESVADHVIEDPTTVRRSFLLSHDVLVSDDGTPSSRSWSTICKMVSELEISSTQKNIQWRTFQDLSAMPYTSLKNTDVLITRTLDFVRSNIVKKVASEASPYGKTNEQFTVCLDIKKEIVLSGTGFLELFLSRQEKTVAEGVCAMMDLMERAEFRNLVGDAARTVSAHATTLWREMGVNMRSIVDLREKGMKVSTQTKANWGMQRLDYVMYEGSNLHERCAICLEVFVEGNWVARFPCSAHHIFHSKCMYIWLKDHNSCPLCRFQI